MLPATSYDPTLVALSVAIAIFAAYTALELAARATAATRQAPWLTASAIAMGGGIWSMHFVGMLALETPDPVTYAVTPTLLSLAVAITATAAAFFWVNRPPGTGPRTFASLLVPGLAMGTAIAGMHYIGMSAMRTTMPVTFDPARVALSVAIAVTASVAGLALAFRRGGPALRIPAAVTMGLAVAGMHYTGMWAAHFGTAHAAHAEPDAAAAGALDTTTLVLWIGLATFAILFLALGASTVVQHRAQRALRLSEARFRVAAEAVGDIIWTNTADGRMAPPQPDWQRFTGQDPATYANYGWSAAIHPDDREDTVARWTLAINTSTTFICEHRVRRHDGTWRLCAVRAVPVPDEAGRTQEWVGVHTDITERHGAEAELRQAKERAESANQAKSTFIANMSHELRTPLTAIIGYSETLEEGLQDNAPAEELQSDITRLQKNAHHLLGLINDVLDLSKIEAGRMDLHIEDVDLAPLLEDVLTTIRPLAAHRANRLVTDFPNPLPTIRTDAAKLRQMLLNLLSNATKFTGGGTITVTVQPSGSLASPMVTFTVADTGIGIPEEHQARLFERFTQADPSTTRRFGGTGLGLALTRAFSDALGGRLEVRSTPGQGSTFTLQLVSSYQGIYS